MKLNSMRIVLASCCLCALAGAAPVPAQTTSPVATAANASTPCPRAFLRASVARARALRQQERFAEAEAVLRRPARPECSEVERQGVTDELTSLTAVRGQWAKLSWIRLLIETGQYEGAAAGLSALAPEVGDPQVERRFAAVARELEHRKNSLLQTPWVLWSWFLTIAPVLLLILAAFFFRWLIDRFYLGGPNRGHRWQLTEVEDKTERDAKALIAYHFSKWSKARSAPITSGLLMMDASAIPAYPSLSLEEDQFELGPDIDAAAITIGGINVAGWFRIIPKLIRWFVPQPTPIKGFAYLGADGRICARLTTQAGEHKKNKAIIAVNADADGNDEAAVARVAEEVTFKMLYALSRDVDAGEVASQLREGLRLLQGYLAGVPGDSNLTPWSQLEAARSEFEQVRMAQPDSLEAHLYEGIALDLLERHDDAAAHFDHVMQLTEDATAGTEARKRNQQATYNRAVSRLRDQYGWDAINDSIRLLGEFIATATEPDDGDNPIFALAHATLADAWANRTIHWRKAARKLELDPATAKRDKLVAVINYHETELKRHLDEAEATLAAARQAAQPAAAAENPAVEASPANSSEPAKANWDTHVVRQVEWATYNARADFHLYAATALADLDGGNAAESDDSPATEENEPFDKHMKDAVIFLRKCEMLLPPGVETLTNLGTLHLTPGKQFDLPLSRQYLERAIALNPNYEYAYYRLAETWELDKWRAKVIETLKRCPIPPGIPVFRGMFERYYVEPKFEYGSGSPPVGPAPVPAPAGADPASTPADKP